MNYLTMKNDSKPRLEPRHTGTKRPAIDASQHQTKTTTRDEHAATKTKTRDEHAATKTRTRDEHAPASNERASASNERVPATKTKTRDEHATASNKRMLIPIPSCNPKIRPRNPKAYKAYMLIPSPQPRTRTGIPIRNTGIPVLPSTGSSRRTKTQSKGQQRLTNRLSPYNCGQLYSNPIYHQLRQ